jgi:hypothetical protein
MHKVRECHRDRSDWYRILPGLAIEVRRKNGPAPGPAPFIQQHEFLIGARHAPNDVADVVGHEQCALPVDGNAHRPAVGFFLVA